VLGYGLRMDSVWHFSRDHRHALGWGLGRDGSFTGPAAVEILIEAALAGRTKHRSDVDEMVPNDPSRTAGVPVVALAAPPGSHVRNGKR
jgi:hypothetical protein